MFVFYWSNTDNYIYGAGEGTRTPDLLITNQLLYQLSYTSTITLKVVTLKMDGNYRQKVFKCQGFFEKK